MDNLMCDAVLDQEPGFLLADAPADLAAIFDPAVNAVALPRACNPAIEAYFATALAAGVLTRGFRVHAKPGLPIAASLLPGHDVPGRECLLADIASLSELLGDLLGAPVAGIRLEVLNRAMCPRFHVDHVGIRLLCTYRGAGTDYLSGACADRARLGVQAGESDSTSGLILDPSGIRTVAPFSVLLIKGAAWQGNAAHGAIHRSPLVLPGTGARVLLAIDGIWD